MATIDGTTQDDNLVGTSDADTMNGLDGRDFLQGGDGDDRIYGGAGRDRLYGDNGNDVIFGGDDGDTLVSGAGEDELHGEAGDDTFWAGGGDDVAYGGEGNDNLNGDGGNDTLDGGIGNDTLNGSVGNDTLIGGTGTNTLNGGSGNDVFVWENGTDTIDGGTGLDTLQIRLRSDQVGDATADLESLRNFMETNLANAGGDINILATQATAPSLTLDTLGITLTNVEQATLFIDGVETSFDDILGASSGGGNGGGGPVDPTIYGTDGDDDLTGTAQDDVFYAGLGRDFVEAGDGADEIHGEDGNDRLYGERDGDFIYGDGGNDTLAGGHGDDQLFGGEGDDAIYAGGDHDLVEGEAGNDRLFGDGGNDTINGGAGNDELFGHIGTDILNGGEGDDIIDGQWDDDVIIHTVGEGNDTIRGGSGTDKLVINVASANLSDAVRADLGTLETWLAGNQDANSDNGAALQLTALGVTISDIENVEVYVDDVQTPLQQLVNQAPTAAAQVEFATNEDVMLAEAVIANDADGDPLNCVVHDGPENGTVVMNEATGEFTYTPANNFAGEDSFVVRISDPSGAFVDQTVMIDTAAVADAPTLSVTGNVDIVRAGNVLNGTDRGDMLLGDRGASNTAQTVELDIAAALNDQDGSETLSVTIASLPAGTQLSAGTVNQDGSVTLTAAELSGLTMTTTATQNFSLDVRATATESNGDVAETSETIAVNIDSTGRLDDTIDGRGGSDYIDGGQGNDYLVGNDGHDFVFGGSGNDTVVGGDGYDMNIGGSGFDTIDYSGAQNAMTIDLAFNYASGMGIDYVSGFEKAIGSGFNDEMYGDYADNILESGAGNDRVWGGGGDDTIVADKGNDRYDGDGGFDTIDYSGSDQGVTVDFQKHKATGNGNDKIYDFEAAIGSDHDDKFIGSNSNDVFVGGDGNDSFDGNKGGDVFTGGAGNDVFVWSKNDLSKRDVDTITDFEVGDVLDVSDAINPRRGNDINDYVTLTETADGTMVSANTGGRNGMRDVVMLEGVHGLDVDDMVDNGWLIV